MTSEELRIDLLREAIELERQENSKDWKGEERRGIPIHILNYMDERLKTHTDHIEHVFHDHTADEMERYNAILDKISSGQKAAVDRHESIMEVISHFNGKCKDVHSAFLKTSEGEYDFDGHRYDHDKRKKFGEWWERVKGGIVVKVMEWGSLAFIIWVIHSIWESLLKGPSK